MTTTLEPCPPETLAPDPASLAGLAAAITEAARRANEARAALDAEQADFDDWTKRLVTRSREVANEMNLCGVYDKVMRRLGLPGRISSIDMQVRIPVRRTITVDRLMRDISGTLPPEVLDRVRDAIGGDSVPQDSTSDLYVSVMPHPDDATGRACRCLKARLAAFTLASRGGLRHDLTIRTDVPVEVVAGCPSTEGHTPWREGESEDDHEPIVGLGDEAASFTKTLTRTIRVVDDVLVQDEDEDDDEDEDEDDDEGFDENDEDDDDD